MNTDNCYKNGVTCRWQKCDGWKELYTVVVFEQLSKFVVNTYAISFVLPTDVAKCQSATLMLNFKAQILLITTVALSLRTTFLLFISAV